MQEIKSPYYYSGAVRPYIFLAGSIEMGAAENWQNNVTRKLADLQCTILNPRRDNWDSSWEQKKTNPKFKEQVMWELQAQTDSDLILMYFDPNTKSPITLLELGIFNRKNMIVCCPNGFWRKGNVDIVCDWRKIRQAYTLDDMTIQTRHFVSKWEQPRFSR